MLEPGSVTKKRTFSFSDSAISAGHQMDTCRLHGVQYWESAWTSRGGGGDGYACIIRSPQREILLSEDCSGMGMRAVLTFCKERFLQEGGLGGDLRALCALIQEWYFQGSGSGSMMARRSACMQCVMSSWTLLR